MPTVGETCSIPAKGAVAAGTASATPGCRATRCASDVAARELPTGPCQSSGTLRTALSVIVPSEWPTKSTIAPSSPTAAASVSTRNAVRPGARSSSTSASGAAILIRPPPGRSSRPPARPRALAAPRCVATTSANSNSRRSASIRSSTRSPVSESRCPVGSSQSKSSGRCASARAIATRCASPPESSAGRCSAFAARPTSSSSGSGASAGSPASCAAKATFSNAVKCGSRFAPWKTYAIPCARTAPRAERSREASGRPCHSTAPAVGSTRPPSTCSSVVLPEPERPSSARFSRGRIPSVTPSSARTADSPSP